MTDATTLYRVRRADGNLLYVGISMSMGLRLGRHSKNQPWWDEAASVDLEHFATRAEAEEAERVAIRSEDPTYNTIRYRPPVGTPQVSFWLEDALWDELGRAAALQCISRPAVIRQFVRWYLRTPNAMLPPGSPTLPADHAPTPD